MFDFSNQSAIETAGFQGFIPAKDLQTVQQRQQIPQKAESIWCCRPKP
jgi:hypothetical protein